MAGHGKFHNIHTISNLMETKFLSDDFASNWENIWSCREFNIEMSYLETKAYVKAKKQLWYNGWVTLCGYPGNGTSSMAEHLVCHFVRQPWSLPEKWYGNDSRTVQQFKVEMDKYLKESLDDEDRPCYAPVYVSNPDEYREKVDMDAHQIVVIDNIFGVGMLNWTLVEDWRPYLQELLWTLTRPQSRPRTLVVVCVNKAHLAQAPGEITHLEWFRQGVMIDLSAPQTSELPILFQACKDGCLNISVMELSNLGVMNQMEHVGLVYWMYHQCKTFQYEGQSFFHDPWKSCLKAIDQVYKFDRIFYYTMCVAVVLDGHLDLSRGSLLEYDDHTKMVMERLIHVLKVPEHVDLEKMRYAAKKMLGFFFQSAGRWVFKFFHNKVYHMCAMSLCRMAMGDVIDLFSQKFILNHVCTRSYLEREHTEMMINCDKNNHWKLAQRFTQEIMSGALREFLGNDSCSDEMFVSTWFKQMRESNKLEAIVQQTDPVLKRSMFYWSCYYGRGPIVKEILSAQDLNPLQTEKVFGLQAACAISNEGSDLVVECLLRQGVDINSREKYEEDNVIEVFGQEMQYLMAIDAKPVHVAALRGHEKTVEVLICQGADVNEKAADNQTLLHRAASRHDKHGLQIVKFLIGKGADIRAKTHVGRTPVQEALVSGKFEMVQELVTAGAELFMLEDQRSLMSLAINHSDVNFVNFLLRKDISPNSKSSHDGFYPIHLAVFYQDENILRSLTSGIFENADINQVARNGWTALHLSCFLGNTDIALRLLENKANVNMQDFDGRTPLHIAASLGHVNMVELLLSKGAKTELLNHKMEAPLVVAAKQQLQKTFWLLLLEGMELPAVRDKRSKHKGKQSLKY